MTDTHMAGWVLAAGAQYETCRGRLAALIGFIESTSPATP